MAYPYNYVPVQYQQGAYPQMAMPTPQSIPAPQAQPGAQYASPGTLSPSSRPVTSREEAAGIPADFSGALLIMPDIAHNRIYIKRWNMSTGAADFMEFVPDMPAPVETPKPESPEYVERGQFEEKIAELAEQIENLKKKGRAKNDGEQ